MIFIPAVIVQKFHSGTLLRGLTLNSKENLRVYGIGCLTHSTAPDGINRLELYLMEVLQLKVAGQRTQGKDHS